MVADKYFKNCNIYSFDLENHSYESMAISKNNIIFLGEESEGLKYCGPNTEVIDLEGKVVIPGMSEAHTHAPGLAYDILFNVNLYNALSKEETLKEIENFVKNNPQKEIYYGRGFNCSFFDGIESVIGPKKEYLDEICKDKPIIISDFGGNCIWMNSIGFEKYNITKDRECPPGGEIQLDPKTGELWGILRNEARIFVPYQDFTEEENYQAMKEFQRVLHKNGYTGVFALRPPGTVEPRTTLFHAFKVLEERGELKLWVHGARDMDPLGDIDDQIKLMLQTKEAYDSDQIKLTTAKFFLDGVVEGLDGYLLEPYSDPGEKGKDFQGNLFWDKEKLKYAFKRVMEAGFQIHCHSIGDGATHDALDCLEAALSELRPGDYRNTLTHLQLVSTQDMKRMAKMNVIANVQVYWHFKSPVMYFPIEKVLLGDRAELEYPLGSLVREGVTIVSSSDYPVTPEPNPFHAVAAGVTRNLYNAKAFDLDPIADKDDPRFLLNKEERVSLTEMLRSFTINGAYARHQEDRLGSLELNKVADFVVLDKDPYETPEIQLENIKIIRTYFGGEEVYRCEA